MISFCNILNNINDGIVVKTVADHHLLFANTMAKNILNCFTEDQQENILNIKKFTAIDLKEDIHPLLDEDLEHSRTPANKMSLNSIVKQLENHGDHYAECTIYRVSIPKQTMQDAKRDGKRLITHVMVEATIDNFQGESCVTIYLKNVTHFVEVQKLYQRTLEQELIEDAENEIVENLAKIMSGEARKAEVRNWNQETDSDSSLADGLGTAPTHQQQS